MLKTPTSVMHNALLLLSKWGGERKKERNHKLNTVNSKPLFPGFFLLDKEGSKKYYSRFKCEVSLVLQN